MYEECFYLSLKINTFFFQQLRLLKDEVVELRRLEDDISHTGMQKQVRSHQHFIFSI